MKKIKNQELCKINGGAAHSGQMCLGTGIFGWALYSSGVIGVSSVVGNIASYCWNS